MKAKKDCLRVGLPAKSLSAAATNLGEEVATASQASGLRPGERVVTKAHIN